MVLVWIFCQPLEWLSLRTIFRFLYIHCRNTRHSSGKIDNLQIEPIRGRFFSFKQPFLLLQWQIDLDGAMSRGHRRQHLYMPIFHRLYFHLLLSWQTAHQYRNDCRQYFNNHRIFYQLWYLSNGFRIYWVWKYNCTAAFFRRCADYIKVILEFTGHVLQYPDQGAERFRGHYCWLGFLWNYYPNMLPCWSEHEKRI